MHRFLRARARLCAVVVVVAFASGLSACDGPGGVGDVIGNVDITNPLPAGPLREQLDRGLTNLVPALDLNVAPRGRLEPGEELQLGATGRRTIELTDIQGCPPTPAVPCLATPGNATAIVDYRLTYEVPGAEPVSATPRPDVPTFAANEIDPTHLNFVFEPPLVDAISLDGTQLPTAQSTRQLRVTAHATVDLTRSRPPLTVPTGMGPIRAQVALPPINVPLLPLPMPSLVALFTAKDFGNQPETGIFVNIRPPAGAGLARGPVSCQTIARQLQPIAQLRGNLQPFVWIAGALTSLGDVVGMLSDVRPERNRCAITDRHQRTWGDDYKLNPGGLFAVGQVMVENEISSMLMIGMPGAKGWFYIDNDYKRNEGWFTLTVPRQLVVRVPAMDAERPTVEPGTAFELGAPAASHYTFSNKKWFDNNLSSFFVADRAAQPPNPAG